LASVPRCSACRDSVTGLCLFIRIVETGSFSKASSGLGITQPTATKHVAALEKRLGARLLHRSTRGVTPTEVGAAYYDKCKAIAQQLDEADYLALLMQARLGGSLRVSTSVALGRRVLTPLVLQFMRQRPELLVELSFEDRYVNLVEQGIDVASDSVKNGAVQPLLERWRLPAREVHAVFPSPKLLPSMVKSLCDFLAPCFADGWWADNPRL